MDLGMRDKLYVLVGGSRGMGLEAAKILAANGGRLALISRTRETLEAVARDLAAEHGIEAVGFVADASRHGDVETAIAEAIGQMGAPRGLLVTSGMPDRNGSLLEASDEDWEANFRDVMMGTVRACRAVLAPMISAGGGQIVTTAAYSARAAKEFLFPYASMKAALVNFTKNLAKTYGRTGVRANCVCPGAFLTERVAAVIDQAMADRDLSWDAAATWVMTQQFKMPAALGRPGRAHEAGELMAFLLSERAGYLTGAVINIDGGTDF